MVCSCERSGRNGQYRAATAPVSAEDDFDLFEPAALERGCSRLLQTGGCRTTLCILIHHYSCSRGMQNNPHTATTTTPVHSQLSVQADTSRGHSTAGWQAMAGSRHGKVARFGFGPTPAVGMHTHTDALEAGNICRYIYIYIDGRPCRCRKRALSTVCRPLYGPDMYRVEPRVLLV